MKIFQKILLSMVCVVAAAQCAIEPRDLEVPAITTLSKMSTTRIEAAVAYYRRRMRNIKTTIYAATIGIVGAVGAGVYAWKTRSQPKKEAENLLENQRKLDTQIAALNPEKDDDCSKVACLKLQQKTLYNQLKALRYPNGKPQQYYGNFWGGVIGQPLKVALTLGLAGLVITSGHQVFRIISGTTNELLQLWWHGYEYWYVALEEQVRTLMNELRESFYQARKVAQQTSTEQQLIIARQQRRAPMAYEVSSHYRLDIVTMYQRLVGGFERLVALMLIIAPSEHHELMHQQITTIISQCNRLASSLESDLNENTHGMLTHYSNKTLDMYHEFAERLTIFLTTYRVYLRR